MDIFRALCTLLTVIVIACHGGTNYVPFYSPWRWRSGFERSPLKRKIGCSNPSRDRQVVKSSSTAKRAATGVSVTSPRRRSL